MIGDLCEHATHGRHPYLPGCRDFDFCGPFEVFSSARSESGEKLFNALTVAETDELVTCRGGLLVQPNITFGTAPKFDIILAPGGYGTISSKRTRSCSTGCVSSAAPLN
ncbi:MAG: hypothetical protein U0075_18490 [Thermomicrobiales bacterium]